MGGPIYHYDEENESTTKFPAVLGRQGVHGEFSQDYVCAFSLDGADGPVTHIERLPAERRARDAAGMPITDNPIDFEFGPDGSLYVLDYGDGFFRPNPDAGLYRVDYIAGNKAPARPARRDP